MEPEVFGEIQTPSGERQKIVALFTIYRDEREVTICQTDAGTIGVVTKSWLRENDHKEVQTLNVYTLETFAMMYATMTLGSQYLGIDLAKLATKLHGGGSVNYEYAGRGEPDFGEEKDPE